MNLLGKKKLLAELREEAGELRDWMYNHTSPDTSVHEFEKYANKYTIICTKISVIEKQW